MSMCDLLRSFFRHSLHLITLAVKFAGCTLDRKPCLYFRRLESDQTESEYLWVVCFCLSILVQISLLIAGGAIPDSKYTSSTLVCFKNHVTDRHAWLVLGPGSCYGLILPKLELHTRP